MLIKKGYNGISLDFDYVNWRYTLKPENSYKILAYKQNKIKGYLIYCIKNNFGTKIGYVMDIIADPSNTEVITALFSKLKYNMILEKVRFISALSFRGNLFYKFFKKRKFFLIPQFFYLIKVFLH